MAHGTSRDFNPTLPQEEIDQALAADYARNAAEYLAQFRTDVEGFVTLEAVEACMGDYHERLPANGNSGGITLPQHDRLVAQLVGLERTVSRGGRDVISHPPPGHDDIANAVAGAAAVAKRATYDLDWVDHHSERQGAVWRRMLYWQHIIPPYGW